MSDWTQEHYVLKLEAEIERLSAALSDIDDYCAEFSTNDVVRISVIRSMLSEALKENSGE